MKLYIVFLVLFCSEFACGQIITTIAGNGSGGFCCDNGPATNAEVYQPSLMFFDSTGSLYIQVWNNRFRKVDTFGIITTVLGDGGTGYSPDGILATAAQFDGIVPGCFDKYGNLIFSDANNMRIRKVNVSTGIISTVAGTGTSGFSGDSGIATAAELYYPGFTIIDNIGNLFIADFLNYRIRKIDTNGIITTYAGTGVSGDSGDGGPATAATFTGINGGLAFDPNWNLLVADRALNKIRKINRETGIITLFAGNGSGTYIGEGMAATLASFTLHGIACDNIGNVYIAGNTDQRVYQIDVSGYFHTIAGTGSAGYNGDNIIATTAQLNTPYGVAVDKCGNVYVGDANNERVRKITFDSCVRPPTNVNDLEKQILKNTVAIFPNPTSSILSIKCVTPFSNISIYSLDGRAIATKAVDGTQAEINVSKLPAGLYFVQVDGVMAGKFLKE